MQTAGAEDSPGLSSSQTPVHPSRKNSVCCLSANTLFVIQVMHVNTYLWVPSWCFRNKCPCLTSHYTRVAWQKLFVSMHSLTDTCLSLVSFCCLTDRWWNQLFAFMMRDHVKLHESYWITYPYKCYPASGQKCSCSYPLDKNTDVFFVCREEQQLDATQLHQIHIPLTTVWDALSLLRT